MGSSLEYTPRIHASPRTCAARLGVLVQELVETGIQLFCNIHTHTAPIIYKSSSSSSVQVCEAHPSLNICPVARPSSCLHLQPSVVIVIIIIIIIIIYNHHYQCQNPYIAFIAFKTEKKISQWIVICMQPLWTSVAWLWPMLIFRRWQTQV